jgi:hypothetical protein
MAHPSHLKGTAPIKVPLHSVIDILSDLQKLGHSDGLRQMAQDKNAFVTIHPETVNMVKDYMLANKLGAQSNVANSLTQPCAGPNPTQCPYATE